MILHKQKVFGIGFHKTGTKSLGKALSVLGYHVCSQFGTKDSNIAATALPRAISIAKEYDAFQDNPWPLLYKELDKAFPGSKFILTICPTAEWLERTVRYFGSKETPMRKWIYGYGSPLGNESAYKARYNAHNTDVQNYFRVRSDDLLVLPLTQGVGWEPLCEFLEKDVPINQPFPHLNRGKENRPSENKR